MAVGDAVRGQVEHGVQHRGPEQRAGGPVPAVQVVAHGQGLTDDRAERQPAEVVQHLGEGGRDDLGDVPEPGADPLVPDPEGERGTVGALVHPAAPAAS